MNRTDNMIVGVINKTGERELKKEKDYAENGAWGKSGDQVITVR